jgi:hypothetical protein
MSSKCSWLVEICRLLVLLSRPWVCHNRACVQTLLSFPTALHLCFCPVCCSHRMTGYALGFFQGCGSVAYGSDTILDLIPADTVAYLIIAAGAAAATTYGSPCADRSVPFVGSGSFGVNLALFHVAACV